MVESGVDPHPQATDAVDGADLAAVLTGGTLPLGLALLVAEELRRVRLAFDRLIGRATTEDMLDTLFGRFCIGK